MACYNAEGQHIGDNGFWRIVESLPAVGHITGRVYKAKGNHEKAKRAYARANGGTVATACVVAAVACAPVAATTGTIAALTAAGGAVGAAAGNTTQVVLETNFPSEAEGGSEASDKTAKDWLTDIACGAVGGAVGGAIAPAGATATNAMQPVGNKVVGKSIDITSKATARELGYMAAKRGVEKGAATVIEQGSLQVTTHVVQGACGAGGRTAAASARRTVA